MTRPRLLDLFAGAQGAGVGYARAGFEVHAVDIEPHERHPEVASFTVADAMDVLADAEFCRGFDVVHASPPCQAYSGLGNGNHPDLVPAVLEALRRVGGVWVVENIPAAPITGVLLCGSMFGLGVRRHRIFAASSDVLLMSPGCGIHGTVRAYYGKPGLIAWKPPGWDNVQREGRPPLYRGTVDQAPADMGIDWMSWDDLREAIPPAYATFVGEQLLDALVLALPGEVAS